MFEVIKPIREKINNSLGKEKFIEANELISYGKEDNIIHIHVVPKEKIENIFISFREGMEKISKIVREDEEIEKVTATSWIVAEHPRALERVGFTIDGEIGDEMRKAHFSNEKRPIWGAHISREELLKKYQDI